LIGALPVLVAGASAHGSSVPSRATMRFAVTYTGFGRWHTDYRSTSPNPGGAPDHNHAHDWSTQRWSLRFTSLLTLSGCPGPGCSGVHSLSSATGTTSATGHIDHVHVDGLYRFDDVSERCRVSASTPAGARLAATLVVRYRPASRSIVVRALIPVEAALTLLPSACPSQGDSIDGLADNYFTPGLSFARGFGPDRWFLSRRVVIPVSLLDRMSSIRIRFSDTRMGTPPANCVVPDPARQRCHTGGFWTGVVALTKK
jgi:hypothetical protein